MREPLRRRAWGFASTRASRGRWWDGRRDGWIVRPLLELCSLRQPSEVAIFVAYRTRAHAKFRPRVRKWHGSRRSGPWASTSRHAFRALPLPPPQARAAILDLGAKAIEPAGSGSVWNLTQYPLGAYVRRWMLWATAGVAGATSNVLALAPGSEPGGEVSRKWGEASPDVFGATERLHLGRPPCTRAPIARVRKRLRCWCRRAQILGCDLLQAHRYHCRAHR